MTALPASIALLPLWRGNKIVAYATVDAGADADLVLSFAAKWHLTYYGYAEARHTLMHRLLLGLERGDGKEVDHINRDRLDNRRSNLRVCTRAENAQNFAAIADGNSSRYRGVYLHRDGGWCARGTIGIRSHYIGLYSSEIDAASAAARWRAAHYTHSAENPELLSGPDPVRRDERRGSPYRERNLRMAELWRDGLTGAEIAHEIGCSAKTVHDAIYAERGRGNGHLFPHRYARPVAA